MHCVDVTVTHVDPNCLQGEAELLPWDLDDNGRLQAAGEQRQFTVGGGVTWWRVRGEGAGGDGAGLEAAETLIWNIKRKKFRYHHLFLFYYFTFSSITTKWRPVVIIRDRAEIDADLGTFPPQESLCLSGVSNWLPKRRGPVGSLGDECLAPVLLLRILILRRFDTTTSAADIIRLKHTCISTTLKYM